MKNTKILQSVVLILILIFALAFFAACNGETDQSDFPKTEDEMLKKWNDLIVDKNIAVDSMRIVDIDKWSDDSQSDSIWDETFIDQNKISAIIDALDHSGVRFEKEKTEGNVMYGYRENGAILYYDGIWIGFWNSEQELILGLTVGNEGYIHIYMPDSDGCVFKSVEPISYEDFEEIYLETCIRTYDER